MGFYVVVGDVYVVINNKIQCTSVDIEFFSNINKAILFKETLLFDISYSPYNNLRIEYRT
jgi:hypothetical protein